jgi:hypothetical protein
MVGPDHPMRIIQMSSIGSRHKYGLLALTKVRGAIITMLD